MPYRTVKVYTRSDLQTVFHTKGFKGNKENWEIINQRYPDIVRNITLPTPMTLEIEVIYESEAQYQEYQSDPLVVEHFALIDAYCRENNITIGDRVEHGPIGE